MRFQPRTLRAVATVSLTATLILAFMASPAEADAALRVRPHSGPPGTSVKIHGSDFGGFGFYCNVVYVSFKDARGQRTPLGTAPPSSFDLRVDIPAGAAPGKGRVIARRPTLYNARTHTCSNADDSPRAATGFTVTGSVASSLTAVIHVRPHFGPPGTSVRIKGSGFPLTPCQFVGISFTDAQGTPTGLGQYPDPGGSLRVTAQIPLDAVQGKGSITVRPYFIRYRQCGPSIGGTSVAFKVTAGTTVARLGPMLLVRPR
jgi:hypothetical protein